MLCCTCEVEGTLLVAMLALKMHDVIVMVVLKKVAFQTHHQHRVISHHPAACQCSLIVRTSLISEQNKFKLYSNS